MVQTGSAFLDAELNAIDTIRFVGILVKSIVSTNTMRIKLESIGNLQNSGVELALGLEMFSFRYSIAGIKTR